MLDREGLHTKGGRLLSEPGRALTHIAHIVRDRQKLLNRIHRIRGQLDAIERGIHEELDCSAFLQLIAACRGVMNGLMAEVLEGHVRFHVLNPDQRPTSAQARAAQELLDVVRAYLK